MLVQRVLVLAWVCLLGSVPLVADDSPVRFESDVRPIFKTHCFHCHGEEEKIEGNLDLRLVRSLIKGGDSGAGLVAGQPVESLILQRVVKGEMPPKGKRLSDKEIATLTKWVEQGALTARPEPEALPMGQEFTEEERHYWAFQPVTRPSLPGVKQLALVANPIDRFLLAKLETEGQTFSPEADRATLVRRLSFDLLGLPPTPELMTEMTADTRPDWYERLVDRMLADPAYGERWGRHWLDPVGYADSDGYVEDDPVRPWAFRYRDYVIRSLNADKPLSEFIIEQLAGDEVLNGALPHASEENTDRLVATGFLRMAPDGTGAGGVDQNTARNDVMAETIKIVSTTLLGMTVGCAQCHEHRYDPISQADYYRVRAIFEPALDWKNWRDKNARLISLWTAGDYETADKNNKELAEAQKKYEMDLDAIVNEVFEREVGKVAAEKQTLAREAKPLAADKRTPEQTQLYKDLPSLNVDRGSVYLYEQKRVADLNKANEKNQADIRAKRPPDNFVACLTEPTEHVPPTHLFSRGDFNQPRQVVPPGDLSVLPEPNVVPENDPHVTTSGRRLAWAKHLAGGQHPLVARVLVNRVWMHHFGRGIVATPGDFGRLGEPPSHPELLNWLASELVSSGWSLKHLQRAIVTSTAYRQSSKQRPELVALDPDNRLLGRMSVRRLEAEAIRDAMLVVTGSHSQAMYGPPAPVNPDEVGQIIIGKATRDGNGLLVAAANDDPDQYRRSLYIQVRRSQPLGMIEPFDIAATAPNCELRRSSTAAPQSLLMMNNAAVLRFAERFAARVAAVAGDDDSRQAEVAWQLAYGVAPVEAEVAGARELLATTKAHFEQVASAAPAEQKPTVPPAQQALAVYCQALLSSNRFLYVD
ncbi:MAG: DUF1553 domain-containing protein [Planctomycetota bacterium]|nr:MAG: DUF1553 domain-containing protein [Planctomycetota bacterium]